MLRRLVGLAVLLAMGLLRPPAQAEASGLLIADGGFGGTLEIKEQRVRVMINNGVAVTEVDQMFLNTENRIVEALYTFPVPQGASVSNFSMWIGGKEMIGEVVEKKRAREIYESYKQVRRDPGLLEQVDYKRFEMRIFPIAAGAEQRVQLTYYQELDFDHDGATLRVPAGHHHARRHRRRRRAASRSASTSRARCRSSRWRARRTRSGSPWPSTATHYWQASLEATAADLSRDVVVAYRTERPRTGFDLITSRTRLRGRLLAADAHGRQRAREAGGRGHGLRVRARRLRQHGQRRQAVGWRVDSLAAFIEALGPEDRFELITFNIAPDRAVQVAGGGGPRHARGGARVPRLAAGPRRHGAAAGPRGRLPLSRPGPHAQRGRAFGRHHRAERAPRAAVAHRERPSGTRVFCIGVGNEVNRPLLGSWPTRRAAWPPSSRTGTTSSARPRRSAAS